MTFKNRPAILLTLAALAMATLGLTPRSANAGIIIDDQTTINGPGGAISVANFGNYDASGADKLVVLVGGGRDRGTPLSISNVTYNGTLLTEAVKASSTITTPQGAAAGIFYIDDPGAAGDLVVNFAAKSWGIRNAITVLELSGTQDGHGPVASSNDSGTVSLSTLEDDSLVLAVSKAVPDNGTEVPQAPLTDLNASRIGSGFQFVASPSMVNPTFTDFSNQGQATAAAAFAAVPTSTGPPGNVVPEPASIAIWSLLGLCLAGYGYRRRRNG